MLHDQYRATMQYKFVKDQQNERPKERYVTDWYCAKVQELLLMEPCGKSK
jgi:hypothetical protein